MYDTAVRAGYGSNIHTPEKQFLDASFSFELSIGVPKSSQMFVTKDLHGQIFSRGSLMTEDNTNGPLFRILEVRAPLTNRSNIPSGDAS